MLRVNSDNVLIVPPFEAAWLTDEQSQLHNSRGCVEFEVKGHSDVSIIFKATPGGRRWQYARGSTQHQDIQQSDQERHYTVIIGSHCNSCLKIERNDQEVYWVKDEPCATLSAREFRKFWVELSLGLIQVGGGAPGSNIMCSWQDPSPLPDMKFVGLTAWDTYNSYRHISVHPSPSKAHLQVPASTEHIPTLVSVCSRAILDSLHPTAVCRCLHAAEALAPALDLLQDQLLAHLAQKLPEVVAQDPAGFASLPASVLAQLLLCPSLVCQEKDIFDAVMLWYAEDPHSKAASMADILPLIRFPLMSNSDLQAVSLHPLASRHPLMQELISEAFQSAARASADPPLSRSLLFPCPVQSFNYGSGARPQAGLSIDSKRGVHESSGLDPTVLRRQRRRNLGGARELMYLHDGDHEGVCHHFGTDMGTKQWVNPVLTGRLQVRASSPLCRHTDAKAMVDSRLSRSNMAGPRQEEGSTRASWWSLDLGCRHRLACNYYTLRHDASNAFLRSWVLQGCEDVQRPYWIDMRHHHNDTSISMHGQYASWPVEGHAATVPCQAFRILLTGANASLSSMKQQDFVCLSSFEFYGYLHDVTSCSK